MNAKITALIPTYRRPKYLRRSILSVLGQSYKNLQLSVFDNDSRDETKDVVSSLNKNDGRIKYHCHPNNIGALANFRHAFNSVDTPYFSILSDDDFLSMDFYKNAIDVLDNHPEVMFVILNTLRIDECSNLIGDREATDKLSFFNGISGFDELHSGNIPSTWTSMVFRKDVAKIYEEMENEYDIASDMRFLFRAASRYNYAYLSKVGAFFTVHSESASASIKEVDIAHQGVQISRYVEIFYDKSVSQDIRDRTIFYIKRLLYKKPHINRLLFRIIINFIAYTESSNQKIEEDIEGFNYAGYSKASLILNHLHNSRIAKIIIRLLFGRFYKQKLIKNQSKMLSLQNGIYKKQFDYVKKISL